ncbi:DUF2808 domain-containing protein [Nostoc sp. 106C]|uniref:DUF2808 domain-containing protein n=2 Tax=Nostoc sp. 106C TaxID=1932667 RepID=UPI000A3A30C5|nr:DUF2808 domain-containing protein [Nostoc sp. 106C]OUL32606.1 hypothetical protein BV375_09200 [Nostoc sp. 106C]
MKNISSVSKAVLAFAFGICMLPISKTYAIDARTTYNDTSIPAVTYYFTVAVPASGGKPLQQVTLTQIEGSEDIEFDAKQSRAFVGTSDRAGEKLPVSLVKNPSQDDSVTIQFAQPLPSGKTVTIALKAYSNPTWDGVYLFDLKAAPANQSTESQPLGIARLQFYSND